MRNRAKCRLCGDILESFTQLDVVTCSCGEISIAGGNYELISWAKDYGNFLRVDESGVEMAVKYEENHTGKPSEEEGAGNEKPITLKELIDTLDAMVKGDEKLPDHALFAPITSCDLIRYMMVVRGIFTRILDIFAAKQAQESV
jgi:hypothetical protein